MRHLASAAFQPRLEDLEARTLLSTCHVSRLTDLGGGSGLRGDLRYCINYANQNPGPDAIDFKVNGTITLSNKLPDLSSDIAIYGPGTGLLTVDAMHKSRVFYVIQGASVQISGLTIFHGYTGG